MHTRGLKYRCFGYGSASQHNGFCFFIIATLMMTMNSVSDSIFFEFNKQNENLHIKEPTPASMAPICCFANIDKGTALVHNN